MDKKYSIESNLDNKRSQKVLQEDECIRSWKKRIRPTQQQIQKIQRWLGINRKIYNHAWEYIQTATNLKKKNPNWIQLKMLLLNKEESP